MGIRIQKHLPANGVAGHLVTMEAEKNSRLDNCALLQHARYFGWPRSSSDKYFLP